MPRFPKNEKPPRLHGEIIKFLADSFSKDPVSETQGSFMPSQHDSAKKMASTRQETSNKPQVRETSHDTGKMERETLNEISGSHFFHGATHKSQKEFSEAKSGLHETFSFGRIDSPRPQDDS
jgi:hypothetical protein